MDHAELIEALGGGTVICDWLFKHSGRRIDREAVYKWHKRNRVPWKWRGALLVMATAHNLRPPEDFLPGGPL